MGFILKFILISIAITWLFRLAASYFVGKFFGNVQRNQRKDSDTKRKSGKFSNNADTDKKINKDVGEYVDYEEIK